MGERLADVIVARRFVVTIDRRGPRLAEFLQQPGAARFEIFDGLDLRTSPEDTLRGLVDDAVLQGRYGRSLAPGEVGCALSHRNLMSVISADRSMADDDVALVVEDDAVLHPQLESLLEWLVAQPFDVMPLHHGSASRLGMDSDAGSRIMDRLYPLSPMARRAGETEFRAGFTTPESWMLTVGYLVRKRAASHLAHVEGGPLRRVADDYRSIGDLGLRVCQVRPSLVWESTAQESVITASGRVLGASDDTEQDVIARMEVQAASSGLRTRKLGWLVARDLSSRLPWSIRHSAPAESVRGAWNGLLPKLPPRVRHLLRPGLP